MKPLPVLSGSPWRASVLAAVGGIAVVALLLGLIWARWLPIVNDVAQLERRQLPLIRHLQTARSADLDASVALRNMLLVRDARLDAVERERFLTASRDARQALEDYASQSPDDGYRALFDAVIAARQGLDAARVRALDAERHGDADGETLAPVLQSALDAYLKALRTLLSRHSDALRRQVDAIAHNADDVRLLLLAAGACVALTMLVLAATGRSAMRRELRARDERIATLQVQKDALVREVHHRIKNHLQGLLGLLESRRGSAGPQVVESLRGHVLALIGMHGLQADAGGERVGLADLVRNQVDLVRAGFAGARITLDDDGGLDAATLAPAQAVPLALVVTELVVNAIKHGADATVQVRMGADAQGGAEITVANRVAQPVQLDWRRSSGLGTGLGLVAALAEGLAVVWQQSEAGMLRMGVRVPAPAAAGR